MKKVTGKLSCVLALMMIVVSVFGCGASSKVAIDYADAESFEAALNAGENLEGKVVQFEALELHPDSLAGYNVWAGEHLNFISKRNPDIKVGDTVVVRTDTIESSLGSWLITYEKVDNAEITDQTIFNSESSAGMNVEDTENANSFDVSDVSTSTDSSGESSFTVDSASSEELPLEITDCGWYVNDFSSYSDTAYVDFCALIYNPNEKLIARFPKAIVTVKSGDGSILTTDEQVGSIVMPGDTITLCGMLSLPVADVTDDMQVLFDVDQSEFETGNSIYENVRTTDFEFSNVSERNGGSENYITGEITNNPSVDLDMVNLSIVLRKEGKIVYMENDFMDGLSAGKTRAFEFSRYDQWPEHDTIDCSAMVW